MTLTNIKIVRTISDQKHNSTLKYQEENNVRVNFNTYNTEVLVTIFIMVYNI